MKNVVVERGQSLWSIARSQLPEGAPNSSVQKALGEIARANGLAENARLTPQQSLLIPDVFTGLTTSASTRESLPRLSHSGPVSNAQSTRLQASAKPLVAFDVRFSDTERTLVGDASLPTVAGKQLHGQIYKFEGVSSFLGDSALRSLDARFGKLSQTEFDAVHAELGGRSKVKFDASRDYALVDFLPPALQALVNKDLELPEAVVLKGSKKMLSDYNAANGMMAGMDPNASDLSIALTMNCHATAWEAARAYQGSTDSVAIFYGDMIVMDGQCRDSEKFTKLGRVDASNVQELNSFDLKPGDLVQFQEVSEWSRMTTLLHSAVYVGGGVFFEKPNTEGAERADPSRYIAQEETPFRLTTLDDMVAPVNEAVNGNFSIEWLRPKVALEDAAVAFSSSMTDPVTSWAQKKGRELGVELVPEYEQSMGGGIRGESASALVRQTLVENADGSSALGHCRDN